MRGFALQELIGKGFAFTVFEGETRQEYSVEKSLHQGRNATPPDRIDEREVLSPGYIGLGLHQIRLQQLNLIVPIVQYRVELQPIQS